MSSHVTSTTQMFDFIRRCREVGLKHHLHKVVDSAILAEETRMSLARAKNNNGDIHGAKITFREHYKSYNEHVHKLNDVCRTHRIHPPVYGMLDILNVFA